MAEFDRPWDDPHATLFWRNMKTIVPAFNASIQYRVGNEQNVQFWIDNWLGTQLNLWFPAFYQFIQNKHVSVSNSFNTGQWIWIQQQHTWWKSATPMAEFDRPWNDPHATPFWRNMKTIVPAFNASVQYRVGNGQNVQFGIGNWLGTQLNLWFPDFYQFIQNRHVSVSNSFNAGQWIFQHSQLSTDAQVQKEQLLTVLQTVQLTQVSDDVTWLRDTTGFSIRSAYKFRSYTPSPESLLRNLRSIKAPLRVLIFAWLMLNNWLATVDNLVTKGCHLTNMCILCRANEETVTHLFQCCPFTRELRKYISAAFAQTY